MLAAAMPSKRARPPKESRVRLRPQDPFDLIRLLARSQSDPRKAVAELVQNSLDADARTVELTWFTEARRRVLRVWDDGSGIFPELDRPDALRRIARTIGHSHKRSLTPAQRREQMVLGKYGIGLIGFWSVAEEMEIKSRVDGGEVWCLRLREDRSEGEVSRARARRLAEEDTFTQITLSRVHEGAARQVRPSRLQAYLASELRGQLLERDVALSIRDRVARGRATKHYRVQAQPFLGAPLEAVRRLAVPGHEDARVELYLVAPEEERSGVVALACGGTTVLDDLAFASGFDLPRPPWSSGRLEGVIDYPELAVAAGSRRGFVADAASTAFFAALEELEDELEALLRADTERRAEHRRQHLAKDIRRAFRSVVQRLPEYELFDVSAGGRGGGPPDGAGGEVGAALETALPAPTPAGAAAPTPRADAGDEALLYPPGPLHAVKLVPAGVRLAPGGTRTLAARALDADGRRAAGEVRLAWELVGDGALEPVAGSNEPTGPTVSTARATYRAPAHETRALVRVTAVQGATSVAAEARVTVAEQVGRDAVGGIPEPRAVQAPAEGWRSRIRGEHWEFNEGHRDYQAVAATEGRRLRYLIHLFAKEVVLRNFGQPADAELLERMVEVLTHLDAGRRRRGADRA